MLLLTLLVKGIAISFVLIPFIIAVITELLVVGTFVLLLILLLIITIYLYLWYDDIPFNSKPKTKMLNKILSYVVSEDSVSNFIQNIITDLKEDTRPFSKELLEQYGLQDYENAALTRFLNNKESLEGHKPTNVTGKLKGVHSRLVVTGLKGTHKDNAFIIHLNVDADNLVKTIFRRRTNKVLEEGFSYTFPNGVKLYYTTADYLTLNGPHNLIYKTLWDLTDEEIETFLYNRGA
jgi:hypothetical protein